MDLIKFMLAINMIVTSTVLIKYGKLQKDLDNVSYKLYKMNKLDKVNTKYKLTQNLPANTDNAINTTNPGNPDPDPDHDYDYDDSFYDSEDYT